MLSVVVPVVWSYEPFCNFLQYVAELPVVGEIILINNNIQRTPDHPVLDHPKVNHLKMQENIFVNPAWNLGVNLAKYPNICILSDDVAVDLRVFFEADKFISKDIGLLSIGLTHDVYYYQLEQFEKTSIEKTFTKGDLTIKKSSETNAFCGGGSLFFIHKDNWIPIPEELKIYWGDTWQYELQMHLRRINYFINDCFYYTPWSRAVTIGVSAEYQQTEEFKQFENFEYFSKLKQDFIEKHDATS